MDLQRTAKTSIKEFLFFDSCVTNYLVFCGSNCVVINIKLHSNQSTGWLGSRVVSVLHSGAEGPGFKTQS